MCVNGVKQKSIWFKSLIQLLFLFHINCNTTIISIFVSFYAPSFLFRILDDVFLAKKKSTISDWFSYHLLYKKIEQIRCWCTWRDSNPLLQVRSLPFYPIRLQVHMYILYIHYKKKSSFLLKKNLYHICSFNFFTSTKKN